MFRARELLVPPLIGQNGWVSLGFERGFAAQETRALLSELSNCIIWWDRGFVSCSEICGGHTALFSPCQLPRFRLNLMFLMCSYSTHAVIKLSSWVGVKPAALFLSVFVNRVICSTDDGFLCSRTGEGSTYSGLINSDQLIWNQKLRVIQLRLNQPRGIWLRVCGACT